VTGVSPTQEGLKGTKAGKRRGVFLAGEEMTETVNEGGGGERTRIRR